MNQNCDHHESVIDTLLESGTRFCRMCDLQGRARDAEMMERELSDEVKRLRNRFRTRLFIIRQRGRNLFWTCSSTHATGWQPNFPKQSFSPSELTKEIRRLIDEGWWADCEVLELEANCEKCPA